MKIEDEIFMFVCVILVWLMTPGLSLFYGGLVHSKNVLNTIMQSMIAMVVVTFVWILIGFSLSFGTGNDLIGNLDFFNLHNVGFEINKDLSPNIPFDLFMLFQLTFCVIAISILSGSIAERMKFFPYIIFIILWVIGIYSPVAHWVWGGGWIAKLGAIDFAGGTVVHVTSGVSGLILAMMIGVGKENQKIEPNNLVITLIGGFLVWLGWFGFNTGSALSFNQTGLIAFENTMIASCAGGLGWLILEYAFKRTLSLLGLLSGILSGLVVITPAAGFVSVNSGLIMGVIGGMTTYIAINYFKTKLKYNDALDAFGIHGVGGIVGAILTGCFQSSAINKDIVNGLFINGNVDTLLNQTYASVVVVIYSAVITYIIGRIIKIFVPLATTNKEDEKGLDEVIHGERAYFYGELNKLNRRN